jgi:hypothetical protein
MGFTFKAKQLTARLQPGLYPAHLASIEERDSEHGGYLLWKFDVPTDDEQSVAVSTVSSTKFGAQAKARKFVEALLGRTIKPGEEIEPAELCGEACQLVVSIETLSDGSTVNRIEQVLPATENPDDVPF